MPAHSNFPARTHQQYFHERWDFLNDPHVRTLAWLLDAPDLLDPFAEQWQGQVASLGSPDAEDIAWLAELDRDPRRLYEHLDLQPMTRLGRYAEKLMAYYLAQRRQLFAHSVQVRNERKETIGEFDFLLKDGEGLVHWEFATKLYLLEASGRGRHADYFVGPNLADTLGAKVRKIMDRQLMLYQHPASQAQLPMPITAAQALVKGWLFYHGETPSPQHPPGVSSAHCRGFWRALHEFPELQGEHYVVLSRLNWLAPARVNPEETVRQKDLRERLGAQLGQNSTPVLVAVLERIGDRLYETDRGFIVPDDWQARADRRSADS